jgi:hypothetical protein
MCVGEYGIPSLATAPRAVWDTETNSYAQWARPLFPPRPLGSEEGPPAGRPSGWLSVCPTCQPLWPGLLEPTPQEQQPDAPRDKLIQNWNA